MSGQGGDAGGPTRPPARGAVPPPPSPYPPSPYPPSPYPPDPYAPGPRPPWSPYPVQDWSRLPPAEAPVGWTTTAVDPSWGPPPPPVAGWAAGPGRPARPWWPPLIVLLVVVALLGGGLWLADRGGVAAASVATAFVPGDGAVAYADISRTRGSRVVRQTTVTESARLIGPSGILALDAAFGAKIFGVLGNTTPTGQRFWRTTRTDTDVTGAGTADQQQVALYRVDGDVELLGESGVGVARTYAPGLVELPADVAAGARWSSEGRSGSLRYRFDAEAESADAGCLQVSSTLTLQTSAGQQAERSSSTKTWCPGRGVTQLREQQADVVTQLEPVPRPAAAADLRTVTEAYDWSDPARWRSQRIDAVSIDANFGEQPMSGVPGAAAPVMAASGLIIRPSSTDDLVAFTPKTQTSWTSVWRMHPGGRVLSLAVFGDVIVATTSQRQAVGYTDTGVRLWSIDLDDVAFQPAVRATDSTAVLVDAAGTVRSLDLRTGQVRWQVAVGAEVEAPPAAGGGVVVIMDGGGSTSAYEVADGSLRWSAALEASRAVVTGDLVVVQNAATLTAVSLTDGRSRWLAPTQGTAVDLQAFGADVVLATRLGTTVFGADGSVRDRHPAYLAMTVNDGRLIGWGADRAEVLDDGHRVIATWDTEDTSAGGGEVFALADRYGVWRFTSTWAMLGWTDQP